MKYNEIIDKIKKFKIDVEFGKISFDSEDLFEIIEEEKKIMDDFLSKLLDCDDLSITHNEYSNTENLSTLCKNIGRTELEELIIKKKEFLDTLKNESYNLIYHPISQKSSKLLAHQVSLFVIELERIFDESEEKKQNPELTLTKKIALLKELGFFDLEKLSGNDSFKAKITQLITGGSIDSISRNLKNYNLPDDKRDYKYSSFQYSEESKKMISKVKSHTREK